MPPAVPEAQEGPVDRVGLDLTFSVAAAVKVLRFREHVDRGANDTPRAGGVLHQKRRGFAILPIRLRPITSRCLTLLFRLGCVAVAR
jgi:hypothetical protein